MSLSLMIYPLSEGSLVLNETSVRARDCLRLDDDYRIYGQLTDMSYHNGEDVPEKPTIVTHKIPLQLWVTIYEDEGLQHTREDAYGKELTVVYAKQMKKLVIPEDASPWNKAIKALIDALPNDIPIILDWR